MADVAFKSRPGLLFLFVAFGVGGIRAVDEAEVRFFLVITKKKSYVSNLFFSPSLCMCSSFSYKHIEPTSLELLNDFGSTPGGNASK